MKKIMLGLSLSTLLVMPLLAESFTTYKNVNVISSTPEYKQITVRVPYEEVTQEHYTVQVPCGVTRTQDGDMNGIGLDTVIGAVAGVAIGNQIGKGNGRTAAKILGGIGGAYAGNKINRGGSTTQNYCNEVRTRENVITHYEYETKEKITGYINKFKYKGKSYTKVSNHPLERIRIKTVTSF